MDRCYTIALAAMLLLSQSAFAAIQTPQEGATTEMGSHPVGFRSVVVFDHSRQYQPERYTTDSATPVRARPVQISLWYPAADSTGFERLQVADYRLLTRLDRALGAWPADEREQFLDSLLTVLVERGHTEAQARAVLAQRVRARAGAPMKVGVHPLVVYGPSMIASVRGNTVLFEYLASHGYIVAAHPSFGVTARMMDTGWMGLESQVRDMAFTLGYLRQELGDSIDSVALMGHSWGGLAAVVAAMDDPTIAALISLDSSVEQWRDLVVAAPGYDPIKLRVPFLHIETSANVRHGFYESVEFADRYRLSFPTLAHFDVVSSRYQPRGSVKDTLYAMNNRFIRAFLDACLKKETHGLEELVAWIDQQGGGAIKVAHAKGHRPPPTEAELVQMYLSQRSDEAERAVADAKALVSEAYTEATLLRVGELILWSWRHFPEAEEALHFAATLYPASPRVYEMLGNLYWGLGNEEQARANFEKALDLDPSNKRVQANLDFLRK